MPDVSQADFQKYAISVTDTGVDQKVLTVPAETIVFVPALRVTTARIGGTITYNITDSNAEDTAPGVNLFMLEAIIASTVLGLKRNTAALGLEIFTFTVAGSIWLDVTQTLAPGTRPVFTLYALATRLVPGVLL